jgi:hypothetical protein
MKEFSDYEKKIIKELIRVDETPGGLTVLGNVIDFELYPNFYIELKSEIDCPIRISKSYLDSIANNYGAGGVNEIIKQLNNKLLYIVRLLQYLEREDQIYLSGDVPLSRLGSSFDISETAVSYELDDKDVISSLYTFSRKKLIVNDSLKRFARNNYRTDRELKEELEQRNIERQQRHIEKQTRLTAYGILATLILGLITSIPDFVNLFKDDKPIKIESSCCDSVKIKVSLDTVNLKVTEFVDTLIIGQRPTKFRGTKTGPLKVEIVKFNDSIKVVK